MSNIVPGRLYNVQNAADPLALLQHNMEVLAEDVYALKPTPVGGSPNTLIGPPTTGEHAEGELWRDSLLALWRCDTAGTPGTWRQIAPAPATVLQTLQNPPQFPDGYLLATPAGLFAFESARWSPLYRKPWLYINSTPAEISVPAGGTQTSQTLTSFTVPADQLFVGTQITFTAHLFSQTVDGGNQLRLTLGSNTGILILDQTTFVREYNVELQLQILALGANLDALLFWRARGDYDSSFVEFDLITYGRLSSGYSSGFTIALDGTVSPPLEQDALLRVAAVLCRVV